MCRESVAFSQLIDNKSDTKVSDTVMLTGYMNAFAWRNSATSWARKV